MWLLESIIVGETRRSDKKRRCANAYGLKELPRYLDDPHAIRRSHLRVNSLRSLG